MNNTSSIQCWLNRASGELSDAGIPSAKLDAELILTHTLRKNRTFIHAHGDDQIDSRILEILDMRMQLRLDRVPIAYIIGHKEFYGRRFKVTPSTLIPRPESEAMIDLLIENFRQPKLPLSDIRPKLVDVGTGSGCLGITAKLEIPELEVTLIDISRHALTVAEDNARLLRADVITLRSDLLHSYPYRADFILANLPYVDEEWDVSPEIRHEPKEALFAGIDGLALIYRLLKTAPRKLAEGGLLFIEADPRQHEAIISRARIYKLALSNSKGFILAFKPTSSAYTLPA